MARLLASAKSTEHSTEPLASSTPKSKSAKAYDFMETRERTTAFEQADCLCTSNQTCKSCQVWTGRWILAERRSGGRSPSPTRALIGHQFQGTQGCPHVLEQDGCSNAGNAGSGGRTTQAPSKGPPESEPPA
ncbi:hypothetical protein H112_04658 [Trichophyton rubrum D6]|uniref:Uncharacterized protein n=2 Tax=Trichophyton TaxID=5550 RepID=A0A022W2G1_TRIRU|nr:hypothetical protein H100_04666 [Trichophyton rubrum MR850]EZF41331.1 hypothetical protein H102_04654 [Trichophyton rubrum CBS 100081]EZF52253.1 hypothetical protein H103_04660 [Trichophyton rubrum CBS 288.86]EZF62745.1 hypothetical protein H104_04646 [Trichophyton rubrum CBS 289.86]EZF73373.1 hypothetical protein H105_04675 [Trichophyton soudanense CBS 452.61]EZF84058.1 hypothetical protein H110_04655 [Trichophyton rubrum MR1448]EZG06008.1 hypothetical protein H106_04480 [Trichophyton rub